MPDGAAEGGTMGATGAGGGLGNHDVVKASLRQVVTAQLVT